MDEQSKIEQSIIEAINDEPYQKVRKECRKRVFLFNCDKTYSLDSVEKLLLDLKGDIRRELSFDIVKTYFRLSEMSHVAEKAIPKLQMDVAFFVVHAHESRLSINENNAGIGYAKIYQALLQATDGNVIIVIGGDDQYTSKDEEGSSVISRWARLKVSSQFKAEFLDGKKSFIFSWNKIHRRIHEEALLHYFDPSKIGQKFEKESNERSSQEKNTTDSLPGTPKIKNTAASEPAQFMDQGVVSKQSEQEEVPILPPPTNAESNGDSSETEEGKHSILDDLSELILKEYVVVSDDGVDCEVRGVSEEQQMNGITEVGTLVFKTRVRNGKFTEEEIEEWRQQWKLLDELLPRISKDLANVAEANVEVYRVKQGGAARVVIKDLSTSYLSLYITTVIEFFYNVITGLMDNVYSCFVQKKNLEDIDIDWP